VLAMMVFGVGRGKREDAQSDSMFEWWMKVVMGKCAEVRA
jgi:hypothetical protein